MRQLNEGLKIVATLIALIGAGCGAVGVDDDGTRTPETRIDCSYVKCALPQCAQGQHLSTQGGCCPVCVGPESKCATVLCAAVECPEGEQRVFSQGQCCGRCAPLPPVKECRTTEDCPVYNCFACPCPISECRGTQCVTQTPDPSTCTSNL